MNTILKGNCGRWIGMPVTVRVSNGVAGFNSLTELWQAIETADKAMYAPAKCGATTQATAADDAD